METFHRLSHAEKQRVFAAYLKGMETVLWVPKYMGGGWFAAYLKGMETRQQPQLSGCEGEFAAYLKGMETHNV